MFDLNILTKLVAINMKVEVNDCHARRIEIGYA